MHFVILGSGAVGGYYGAKLAKAGNRVTFIARGAHLAAIRDRGLEIVAPQVESFVVRAEATDDTRQAGTPDVVIVAVKTYDNATVLPMLRPMMGPSTVVLTLQNGVDSADEIAAVVGEERVLAGPTYIATALESPGRIVQTGTHRRIVFGEIFGSRGLTDRVTAIRDAMVAADIKGDVSPDARVPLWEKFIYLAPFSGFAGAMRQPVGVLWNDETSRASFLAAAHEVEQVARAEGVEVPPELDARMVPFMAGLPPTMRASLLIDLSQGKPIEVESLQGAAVRRGQRRRIPTPIMSTLYSILKPYAAGPPNTRALSAS